VTVNVRLWWYVARAGGLVAWTLLATSTLWGLALTTLVVVLPIVLAEVIPQHPAP